MTQWIVLALVVISGIIGIRILYRLLFRRKTKVYADLAGRGSVYYSKKYNLSAKPDLITIRDDVVEVRETKSRSNRYYPSDVAQLTVELLCVMENVPGKKYIGIIELANKPNAYKMVVTKADQDRLFESIAEPYFQELRIRAGEMPGKQSKNSPKCRNCAKRQDCWG